MKFIFILLAIVVLIVIVRSITKNRNTQESKISAFEHPSTFKKPPIEMSTKEPIKTISFDKNDSSKPDDAFDVTNN
ncbi:hypothetical protein [Hanstruepera flava]|uniref:hypothetical protein n=1 Tax=Hanstruepera flava TaxID=2930218 RepID=UPI00202872A8|nr:hypothetical protein [Hanstruepera flava]